MRPFRQWTALVRSTAEDVRQSYWFLPMAMALGSALLAFVALALDRWAEGTWPTRLPFIAEADAEGARSVLGAIAGSMITVTGVVFSITIVALTLASSQFGPRLLRNFLRDRSNQLVLGTFVATFLYSLLVLRAVEDGSVPHLATAGAVALAVASLFVLIYFIHHASSSIQASSIIAAVAEEIDDQLPVLFPESLGHAGPEEGPAEVAESLEWLEADGVEVLSRGQGYLRVLDVGAVLSVAAERDVLVRLRRRPGDFVTVGSSLARVGPAARVDGALGDAVRECFALGAQRTAVQDLDFLIGQLTEMAVRALSPGVNDPRTAVACVHRLGAVAGALADRAMPRGGRVDDEGRLRVVAPVARFEALVASCFDPIRRYGSGDASVVVESLRALADAGGRCADPERHRVLAEHAREMHEAFAGADGASKRDRALVEAAFRRTMERLERG